MCSSHLTKSSLRCLYSPALLMYILLVKTMKSCLIFFKSVLLAMHLAVSILSPVNIHTLTPACFNEEMVSATLSCRLSSTPVRQHRCASRSNLDIYCSRSSGNAALYCEMKSSYWGLEISFQANARVLRPRLDKSLDLYNSQFFSFSSFSSFTISDSAPLIIKIYLSLYCVLITFLILLVSLLNGTLTNSS